MHFQRPSSSLPFGQPLPLSAIAGPTYLTAQTLVQQAAYALADRIFAYSPDSFDLDVALRQWHRDGDTNAYGHLPGVTPLQTRSGAGSLALGYIFSKDFDLARRHVPQAIVASSASLSPLRAALDQLALLYSVASPCVAHIAAVDYAPGSDASLVADYTSALALADELGLGLVASASVYEIQHMALFSTLLASILPSLHVYDGVRTGRETTRVIDVLDQAGLLTNYQAILKQISGPEKKHSDNEGRTLKLLEAFNSELGTEYRLFEYHGHRDAEHTLVVFGSVEASLSAQVAQVLAEAGEKVGVVNVRVYRPFVEEEFLEALPKATQRVTVLGQVQDSAAVEDPAQHSNLYTDVLAALSFAGSSAVVTDAKYAREKVWTPERVGALWNKDAKPLLCEGDQKQYIFWDVDSSVSSAAPLVLGQLFSMDASVNVSLRAVHDNLVQGGMVRTDVRVASRSIEAPYPVQNADLTVVNDARLLSEYDILRSTKVGGALIIKLLGYKEEELDKKLPIEVQKEIASKKLDLFVLDPTSSNAVAEDHTLENCLFQVAVLSILKQNISPVLSKLASLGGSPQLLEDLLSEMGNCLHQVQIPEVWASSDPDIKGKSSYLLADVHANSFIAFEQADEEPPTLLTDWQAAAKSLVFREAYGTQTAVRPDLPVKTAVVRVKERRRLTPLSYDRNIFHIEFDLGESGLTYAIGEALGIHAENDKLEVEEFIKWYGLDPDELVEVPMRDDTTKFETRTVYQSLVQNLDIFGRPPKRFYEALSEFASDEKEKQDLLVLSTPDGAIEFKRRAEVDTITFADILLEYPSAHPSFHDIVRIVSPMKRREYSIASSQHVTPNSVSLLIVTVGWVDPRGRDRFGQATRYLNGLAVGAPVTVSVKPSVMKLPPKTTAPIIMAGLGTGLAPFRAFVQERAYQKQILGQDIGEVLLYMGSRHQREEYLYGEEWEAYQDAGIITLLGRAFSRDQPQKIYIQDRMRQTLLEIREAYLKKGGTFYLCGPTWPVPDVTEVLQEAIEVEAKSPDAVVGKAGKVDSRREIETLKDAGRYVLEVY